MLLPLELKRMMLRTENLRADGSIPPWGYYFSVIDCVLSTSHIFHVPRPMCFDEQAVWYFPVRKAWIEIEFAFILSIPMGLMGICFISLKTQFVALLLT